MNQVFQLNPAVQREDSAKLLVRERSLRMLVDELDHIGDRHRASFDSSLFGDAFELGVD